MGIVVQDYGFASMYLVTAAIAAAGGIAMIALARAGKHATS